MIRFQDRHAHKTVCEALKARLVALDWIGETPPFGATSVTFMEKQPEEHGLKLEPNTVAVTFGNEDPFTEAEIGLLTSSKIDFFIDVYGESESTAKSIAADVRDYFSHRELQMRDYTSNPEGDLVDVQLCFEDVFIDIPPASVGRADKMFFRVVQGSVELQFLDDRVTGD